MGGHESLRTGTAPRDGHSHPNRGFRLTFRDDLADAHPAGVISYLTEEPMRKPNSSSRGVVATLCVVVGAATTLAGCGKVVAFEGQTPISIAGDPPPLPPPPPPPPPEPEPPAPPARVELRDNKIEIREKVQFEYNKATILEVSFSLLDEVAAVIKKYPHIKKIQVEGHASSEGNAAHNLRLSDQRANAVMTYLVEKASVPKEMLVAKGFGITRPIADNETEEGREKNRRVEFNVIEQDVTKKKVEIDPVTGKERIVEQTTESLKKDPPPTPEAEKPAADPKK